MRGMKKLKILDVITKWLFALCLPVLLLTISIGWAVNSHWLYNYGFQKYSVAQTPALAELDLEKIANELISYFNSNEEYISLIVVENNEKRRLFTAEEIIHFKDVKGLVWLDYWTLLGTGIYVLIYAGVCLFWQRRRYWQRLAWGIIGGSGVTLTLILALGLGVLLGFRQLFLQFHYLFFSNEFWAAKGYMLLLFRQSFFFDTALFCGGIILGLTVILGGGAGVYLKKTQEKIH
jgi:integral membrane protein (TIGR01906 family)